MTGYDATVLSSHAWDAALLLVSLHITDRPIIVIAARLIRWLSIWHSRSALDPTKGSDVLIFVVLAVWAIKSHIIDYLSHPLVLRVVIAKTATAILVCLGCIFYGWRARALQHSWASTILKQDPLSSPWIIPSKTTHTRLFPKQHSFAYSYLTVAVPVGFKGWCWPMISVDVPYGRAWFHVQASDHLERGQAELGLKGKLAKYLRSQGVGDGDWSHAYLVTAPRFLGYSFNPVSFWYIYDERRVLRKMILEVNNTFDERRMYLLDARSLDLDDASSKFKQTWAKDFHVSPFNSRKGSYSLTASDPFSHNGHSPREIDNTIVMSSSKHHAKIIARLKSEGDPVNPRELTRWQMIAFLFQWWWVGFFTFPRILKEAAKLFFKRRLHVWFRPEVLRTSIGRNASAVETRLQPFVDGYIRNVIENYPLPLVVHYTRPDGTSEDIYSKSPAGLVGEFEEKRLNVSVLTPAFYSHVIHYKHVSEAFNHEAFFADEKNKTVWISDPALLTQILDHARNESTTSELSCTQRLRWNLHKWLRCSLPATDYASKVHDPAYHVVDIRPTSFSELDRFVLTSRGDGWLYLRCCMKVFLAQRLVLGLVPVMDLADLIVRIALCYYFTTRAVMYPTQLSGLYSIFDRRLAKAVGEIPGLWTLHSWSYLKGLPSS